MSGRAWCRALVFLLFVAPLAGCGFVFEVTGEVHYPDGRPVPGITGKVCCGDHCSWTSATTDASGRFVVTYHSKRGDANCRPVFQAKGFPEPLSGTLDSYDARHETCENDCVQNTFTSREEDACERRCEKIKNVAHMTFTAPMPGGQATSTEQSYTGSTKPATDDATTGALPSGASVPAAAAHP